MADLLCASLIFAALVAGLGYVFPDRLPVVGERAGGGLADSPPPALAREPLPRRLLKRNR